jgi:hypothetical protein
MKSILLLIIFVSSSFLNVAQTTRTVDNNVNSGSEFTDLQVAINESSMGDTIYIQPSALSYGNITINKRIHLRGMGHYPEVSGNVGSLLGNILFNSTQNIDGASLSGIECGNITVSNGTTGSYNNLSVLNCRFQTILANTSLPHCSNWIIAGNVIVGNVFGILSKQNNTNWMVVNNIIQQLSVSVSWFIFQYFNASDILKNNIIIANYSAGMVTMFNQTTNLLAENNIILFTQNVNGFNNTASTLTFNNCLTYSITEQLIDNLPGNNNLNNINPEFESILANGLFSYDNNYALQTQSPAIGAGSDNQDIGISGNGFNFQMRGYPADLPYPVQMNLNSTIINQGGSIIIDFKAEGN